ncbi:MAG: fimbria/pilus periplasmic chaperone [Nitrospirota bacterium]
MGKDISRFVSSTCLSVLLFLLLAADCFPANFSVSPIRVFFDGTRKTNILTVKNTSDRPVSLEIKTVLWEHDQEYSPTGDIIFFPKMLTMAAGEEKIIRIGHKTPPGPEERTYRMFISEIPVSRSEEGTTLQVVMNLGVPIFIQPVNSVPEGKIENVSLSNGRLNIGLQNSGNVHFMIKSIRVSGKDDAESEVFNAETAGWYLLAGNSKEYTLDVGKEACLKINNIRVSVETDRFTIEKDAAVTDEMCLP